MKVVKILKSTNDNRKHDYTENESWKLLFSDKTNYDAEFKLGILHLAFKSHFTMDDKRQIENFLWFIKFEYYFSENEKISKRIDLHLV